MQSRKALNFATFLTLIAAAARPALAQLVGNAFTYQGQLRLQGAPVNATADFQFKLWDAVTAGGQLGSVDAVNNITIVDGLFTVVLNQANEFGATAFNGNARWLEVAVRSPAGSGAYTTLTPRQPITATPFAMYALDAAGGGSSPWLQNGTVVHYDGGNVGIGTSAPDDRLALRANPDGGLLSLHNSSDVTKWEFQITGTGGLSVNEDHSPDLLDQSCTASSSFDCGLNPSALPWQSFTAGLTGALVSVQLHLFTSQSATFTVDIFNGEGISGSVKAESVISFGPSSPNGDWVIFDFAVPASVTAGQKYTIRLTGPNGIAAWEASCLDASYAGGKSSAAAGTQGDALFKSFVNNGTGTPVETSRMFLAPGGNIGIGTATPGADLEVAGTVKADSFVGDGSGLTGLASDLWAKSGANISYSAGNVGIGNTSPSYHLDVTGATQTALRLDSLDTIGTRLRLSSSATGGRLYDMISTANGNANGGGKWLLVDNTAALTRMTVDSSGNVGIGTINPTSPLSFRNADERKITYWESGPPNGFYGLDLLTGNMRTWAGMVGSASFGHDDGAGGFVERMRVAGNGFVGIGNSSPGYQLDVTGATQSALRLDSADTIGTRLRLSNSATGGRLYDMVSTANGNASGGGKWLLVDFTTGALTRMAVDSAGNVGVGTAAPGYQLDVSAASQSALRLDSADTIGTRARLSNSATGGRIYDLVSTADGNTNGGGKWLLVDSTASVPRVAVASNGDVGIGTTAPAVRLDVLDTTASDNSASVRGIHSQGTFGIGVQGQGGNTGVDGSVVSTATSGTPTAKGVSGSATGGTAGTNYGVYGTASGGALAYAGYFNGNVNVAGTISKSAGTFKIDHPLDPANKYLSHSFVESPDMMNVYNGNIVTDAQGNATVQLPDWFESLNRDFRYQLTVIGSFSRAMVAQEVQNNAFVIRTEQPNVKVSWQVTGIRHDVYAEAHRTPVEQDKPDFEKGSFIHPELFGQPDALRVDIFHDAENAVNAASTTGDER